MGWGLNTEGKNQKFLLSARFLFCFLLGLLGSKAVYAENWKELKGDHFIVYHQQSDEQFANQVLRKAEIYYKQISSDLGYQRYSNFWQWDNRVKIYIYPTKDEFLKATGQNVWSHGVASYKAKEIKSYEWGEGFLEALLPHEITHLIFRDYVGFEGEIPIWLDEGVAQWEEPAKRAIVRSVMKSALESGRALSLRELTQTDVRKVTDADRALHFYIQAASLIDFLVRKFGADNFIAFCRQLRDGKTLDEALSFTYQTTMRDLTQMEEKWKNFILEMPDQID